MIKKHIIINGKDVNIISVEITKPYDEPSNFVRNIILTLEYKGKTKTFQRFANKYADIIEIDHIKNAEERLLEFFVWVSTLRVLEMKTWVASVDGIKYKPKRIGKIDVFYQKDCRIYFSNKVYVTPDENGMSTILAKIEDHVIRNYGTMDNTFYKLEQQKL